MMVKNLSKQKNPLLKGSFLLMGRLTGIEPANNGATNRRVNHFTTAAVSS